MSDFRSFWNDDSIEREFEAFGFECCTRTIPLGHRCGYVALPVGHPLYGKTFDALWDCDVPDVDGGVTFSEKIGDKWVLGWDAAHAWHRPDPSIMGERMREMFDEYPRLFWHDEFAHMVDADEAVQETRNFALGLSKMKAVG